MPVPQENSLFVEQASCLFLRMVQDVSLIRDFTRKFTLCGTGILPILENGARCEFDPRFIVAQFKIIKKTGFKSVTPRLMTAS
jgi:hypothetical protein